MPKTQVEMLAKIIANFSKMSDYQKGRLMGIAEQIEEQQRERNRKAQEEAAKAAPSLQ